MIGSRNVWLALPLVAAGAVAVVVAHFAGAEEQAWPAMTGGALISANRSHLSVCVDTGGGQTPSTADVSQVRQELLLLKESPDYLSSFGEPEAVAGCPQSPVLASAPPQSANDLHRALHDDAVAIRSPDLPSPHRLFVYVVAPDTYQDYFRDGPFTIGAAEMYCGGGGHVCAEVTTSLYLPKGYGEEALREGLERALPISRDGPTPTMADLSPCIHADPPPWCRAVPPTLLPRP